MRQLWVQDNARRLGNNRRAWVLFYRPDKTTRWLLASKSLPGPFDRREEQGQMQNGKEAEEIGEAIRETL